MNDSARHDAYELCFSIRDLLPRNVALLGLVFCGRKMYDEEAQVHFGTENSAFGCVQNYYIVRKCVVSRSLTKSFRYPPFTPQPEIPFEK